MFSDHKKTTSIKYLGKLSQEFTWLENRILRAFCRLDDLLMNPLTQGYSGNAPETPRNAFSTRPGTNEEDSLSDPHPEAGIFKRQTIKNSGPEDGHDMVTGVQKESLCGHDMVTEATEKIRNRHDMVTGVHGEVTYCSPSASLGKQKRTTLPVSRKSAVRIPLRQLKQTKTCWPFSS